MGNIKKVRNPGDIMQLQHSDSALSQRNTEHGFVIGINIQSGNLGVHPDIATAAVLVGENRHLLVTNTDSAFQYVTVGGSGMAVASASNGVPIPPNGQIRISTGENKYVRASTSDVHCVEIED